VAGARILVIDDEPQIRRALARSLEGSGFDVRAVGTGADAVGALKWRPEIILLDLMLPDVDGLDLARRIRAEIDSPILILSAHGDEARKVAALDDGADDYITKPFGIGELLARIRVALRHAAGQVEAPVIEAGELRIDVERRVVTRAGVEIHLTPTEYEMLKYLALHAGKVVTHRMLLQRVWGPEHLDETQYSHVFMSQLRKKIEPDPARPQYILTEPGVGYRFRPLP
jgi:two-component system, OmpR family, KDP operon response regulator KdpE